MSLSARRLTGAVPTGRFSWQPTRVADEAPPAADLAAFLAGTPPGHPRLVETHEMMLPSATAERTRAIEREAFARGYTEAERAGEEAAAARIDPIVRRLITTIDEVAALRVGLMRRTERELVRLAISMAERIVRRELDHDREALVAMARVAIDRLGENVVASIHLNPTDLEATSSAREDATGSAVTLVADPSIPRGGCRVHSAFGIIDASVDTQIQELTRALLGDERDKDDPDGVDAGA
jgi:flagellar biosynthesis/type III secretory pathway protein FliH